MAKQISAHPLRGTLGEVTYYILNGKAYARSKSSLDRKRFNRDPRFANSRRSSERLKIASRIGSAIYRTCFPGINNREKYNQLTGEAVLLLKLKHTEDDVARILKEKYSSCM